MIAEESTAWGNLTSMDSGGLGFHLKWNMGYMNDTLAYAETPHAYRAAAHERLTFSLTYAFGEKYLLPISHDEVVHGKKSLLDRHPGAYREIFAGARAHLAYMMLHPGKKLLFMGCEIAQFCEWDYKKQVEWFLLDYPQHAAFQHYVATLNHLYLSTPALFEQDGGFEGFQWIDADNRDQSVISLRRIDRKGREVVAVINYAPVCRHNFRVGLPYGGVWEEILNSDAVCFGGDGVVNDGAIRTEKIPMHGMAQSAELTLPPLGAVLLRCRRKAPQKRGKIKEK